MPNVDRREFLKLVGAGGVGAGAGWMLAQSVRHPVEHLIPYPVPPEEFSPGIATWYNSVCRMCPAGCGISVRTHEGRAKKIEGNPLHPVNQGRLCALGQAGLQELYNPDRLTGPLVQRGARGSDEFVKISWPEGLNTVAERLADAPGRGIHFLSEGVRGQLAGLLETFMQGLGSEYLLHFDFAHPHSLYAAIRRLFGGDRLPYYDLANARYVLSFGADFLNNWLSPVHYGLGFGHSRQGGEQRGRFVQIEPRMSLSGAAADEWIPARPGSEGMLALGIAHQVVAGHYDADDAGRWRATLAAYTPDTVAEACGVPAETIVRVAAELADARGLAIGGGPAGAHTNGADILVAINALNYLVDNIGRPGGVVLNPEPAIRGTPERQANHESMVQLARRARNGDIEVLIVSNANPVFHLPEDAEFRDALASIPTIVSLSSFMDDTTIMADVILPSHTYLESWGDDFPEPGVGFSVGAVSQPVVAPLFDTRATGDIVLELGRRLGLAETMPWASTEAFIKDGWRQIHARGAGSADDFEPFWRDVLVAGVWGENQRHGDTVTVDPDVIDTVAVATADFAGASDEFPFVLQPYLSTALFDGRGANLPWMQELPDPMTSIVYGSWVEMNPKTAAGLGLRDGDLVTIASQHGEIEAPVIAYPAIMPDVVAMPVGQGHEALGRYARQRGTNPIRLLAPAVDDKSGALATGATRVSIAATGRRAEPVRTGGESRELGRGIVQSTADGAGHGAGHGSGHSASLTSIPIVVEPT